MGNSLMFHHGSRGFALVLVLWMLVLLTIMAGSFALTMKRELSVVSNVRDLAQISALSEAGINYAMLMLTLADKDSRWESDGSIYQIAFADATIRVSIVDEAGKIDINNFNEDLLRGALAYVGSTDEEQDAIIDAILDWKDKNDLVRLYGAEKNDYLDAGLSYEPANKNFQVLEELQLVLGMNAQIYNNLEPVLTVYSGRNTINPKKAPKEVLLALPDVTEQAVDDYIALRAENARDGLPAPDFPFAVKQSGRSTNVYTVIAEARLPNGATGTTRAVLKKASRRSGKPFKILEWDTARYSGDSLFTDSNNEQLVN